MIYYLLLILRIDRVTTLNQYFHIQDSRISACPTPTVSRIATMPHTLFMASQGESIFLWLDPREMAVERVISFELRNFVWWEYQIMVDDGMFSWEILSLELIKMNLLQRGSICIYTFSLISLSERPWIRFFFSKEDNLGMYFGLSSTCFQIFSEITISVFLCSSV